MSDDAAYTVTIKGKQASEPWLVIRAETIESLHDRVNEVREHAFFATLANAAKDMHAAFLLGNQLDAEPINPPKSTPPKQNPPAAKPTEASESPWLPEPSLVAEAEAASPAAGHTEAPAAPAADERGRPVPKWKR